jgi:DNA-binding Lrp family transcriptional regulator
MSPYAQGVSNIGSIDRLDADLVIALTEDARTSVSELAARLGVARNTIQARLTRLTESGVVQGYEARVDLTRLGLVVVAFIHLQLAQGALQTVVDALALKPHVLEVNATTGRSDLIVRIAARSHGELQSLIQEVLAIPGVLRSSTEIALSTPVAYRVGPLLGALSRDAGRGRARDGLAT